MVQVTFQHQGNFGFHLGLHQAAGGNLFAMADSHAGKQRAEVGRTDTQLLLHGQRGQTDLASDQALARRQAALRVDVLHGIGGGQRVHAAGGCGGHGIKRVAQRGAGRATVLGLPQRFGDLFKGQGHVGLPGY